MGTQKHGDYKLSRVSPGKASQKSDNAIITKVWVGVAKQVIVQSGKVISQNPLPSRWLNLNSDAWAWLKLYLVAFSGIGSEGIKDHLSLIRMGSATSTSFSVNARVTSLKQVIKASTL